jgi:hypothetical protein
MNVREFVGQVSNFDAMAPREKICVFAWYLHTHREAEIFDNDAIRDCFREADLLAPDVTVYLPRMADKQPPDLIRVRGGYKLEGKVRRTLDATHGANQSIVVVTKLLSDLPAKVPNLAERTFLNEALSCYRVGAYRAAIVMAWNLAFDHLLRWIVEEPVRLQEFNAAIPLRYPKRNVVVVSIDDFEEFKESEIVELCRTSNLLTKNVIEVLREKLKRRNIAAHPSQVIITQAQADDTITDLVNNVVLSLS